MIDLVSKRYLFLAISLIIIIPGVIAILAGGLKPGIDFTGGTRWEVLPVKGKETATEDFKQALAQAGEGDALVKGATIGVAPNFTNTIVMDLPGQVADNRKAAIEDVLVHQGLVAAGITETVGSTVTTTTNLTPAATVTGTVTASSTVTGTTGAAAGSTGGGKTYSRILATSELDFVSIGPTVGNELLFRAFGAIGLASLAILIYLTAVFRKVPNALRYGVCAILALLHDVLVVLGVFAILGVTFQVEIDSLFITAVLTVIGFSVHDTIVVFDRVRENIMRRRFEGFGDVVNYSLIQTLGRSITTSVTVIFTLFSLYLFGGASIHTFVLALLIGIISGTYSSIFNASMLLVIWENREWTHWFGRGRSRAEEPQPRAVAR